MSNNLTDKVIIVTGGSGLLGASIIEDIERKNGMAINFDIADKNGSKQFEKVDTTDPQALRSSFKSIVDKHGKIDGLVNNAYPRTKDWGIAFEADTDLSSWKENIDLQLNSYVSSCQEVLPYMKANNGGSIINMASIYGVVGNDMTIYEGTTINTAAPYSAIKGGLINFTRYLASYLGAQNIRVNCISPGGIFDGQHETFVKNYCAKVPMKRMGEPSDISGPVSFLLSDDAKYITGQNLIVDGGWTCI